jgi:hypothetical protein
LTSPDAGDTESHALDGCAIVFERAAADGDASARSSHFDFEMEGEGMESELTAYAAGEGEVFEDGLGGGSGIEGAIGERRYDQAAGLLDAEPFEVDDEVVQRRVLPIEAVEEAGPFAAVVVGAVDVSGGFSTAEM